jgi:branched-subunit amino acid ABC-type transport system permease component
MEVLVQIIATGLTLGAMYALAAMGLSLVWGALGMLNMAHGALMTVGAYFCFWGIARLGLPLVLGLPVALIGGALCGAVIYLFCARFLIGRPQFENTVMIATFGIGIAIQNGILSLFGAYPTPQPLAVEGDFVIAHVHIPFQNLLILCVAIALMVAVAALLDRTRMGRAIRATAQNREAAQLMGVAVGRVYIQVLAIAGALAAAAGVLISSQATLSPSMGDDPMLKAFIICVVAGLANVRGAAVAAIVLGVVEASAQYLFGVRFGFATLLVIVIVALIWRPYGIFGRQQIVRL